MSASTGLREEWKELYVKRLPEAAKRRDAAQPAWPVHLDHCFGRIILDNVVGKGERPWATMLKPPAVKNMTDGQLKDCIFLGNQILAGQADLVKLDGASLAARGKRQGQSGASKRKAVYADEEPPDSKQPRKMEPKNDTPEQGSPLRAKLEQKKLAFPITSSKSATQVKVADQPRPATAEEHIDLLLKVNSHPTMTPYRKRIYRTLLSVPKGSWTTYAALAHSLQSKARPVGNGLRNNPFAPDVPCHRVLASDGSIGGFGGHWGKDGEHAPAKVKLLKEEGVHFDRDGKVKGVPFTAMQDLGATNPSE